MTRESDIRRLDPLALELDGTLLIEASAGTGKTYTITTLVARLVARGVPIESILVVTFTEAAAAELKLRIRARLVQCLDDAGTPDELAAFFAAQPDAEQIRKRLQLALTCFDQAAVMTIHSFCFSVLRENAFESGTYFDMELLADSPGFLRETIMDFFSARISSLDPLFLARLHRSGVTPDSFFKAFIQVVARPGVRTLPETAEFRDVCEEYRAKVGEAALLIKKDFYAIAALIQDHSGLDKRSYSKRNVPAWLESCRQSLETSGPATVFDMTEKGDALYKFTRTRLAEKTKKGAPPAHAFFDRCEDLLYLDRVMAENLVWLRLEFLDFFHGTLAAMKQVRSACFFDDLVNDLWAALEGDRGEALKRAILDRYMACLIDEFQDTDPVQYRIFSRLFGASPSTPFFMIGDPKQAIYAFRGGDIYAYLAAGQKATGRFTLGTNYRSAPALIRGVNRIFALKPDPFGFSEIPFYPVACPDGARDRFLVDGQPVPPLQIAFTDREGLALDRGGRITKAAAMAAFPDILARDILALLTNNTCTLEGLEGGTARPDPGDMAVLVRTNAQAEAVYGALSRRGIPAYLSKTGSVFDSPQALELYDLLSAAAAPDDPGLLKAALSGSLFGCGPEDLLRMDEDQALADHWQERFAALNALWRTRGFPAMINAVFHGSDIFPVPGTGCTERALTNFYHLAELVSGAALQKALSGPFLLDWYRQQLVPETREEGADELRLESDGRAVAIVTIHKSKGLEYPLVFLPFLWDRRMAGGNASTALFHDPDAGCELTLDLGSPDLEASVARAAEEQEAEEMRLLYVALTRASAMCRIYWAGVAGAAETALGRLLHPDGAGEDGTMMDEIRRSVGKGDTGLSLTSPEPAAPSAVYRSALPQERDLRARPFDRQVVPSWRITSYSGLVRRRDETLESGQAPAAGDFPETGPAGEERDEGFSWEAGQDHLDTGGDGLDPILLEAFPKGASAGDFFHNVLETIDFTAPEEIDPAVDTCLARYGFAGDRYRPAACRAVRDILATELCDDSGNTFALHQIPVAARFTELEFCFTLDRWDLSGMAALFESDESTRPYARRLRQMSRTDVRGFLKGFIDLVVCHGGRWYIMDYKSNFLGTDYGDYGPPAMARAMVDHDYLLQLHLYLIALDRYLALRLRDYDYDVHFGGGFYLFIRGMAPGRNTGIYYQKPPLDFVRRLRELV